MEEVEGLKIKKAELFVIKLPLKAPFKTAKETFWERKSIIIKLTDKQDICGFGEVVAFSTPFYTNETLEIAKDVLMKQYFPIVLERELPHPFDIHKWFGLDYPMTVAGLENALLDVYAKKQGQNIASMLFQEERKKQIDIGIVIGDLPWEKVCKLIEQYKKEGCHRFKVKISPETGLSKLQAIRKEFPELDLLADANRSYQLEQLKEIQKMEELKLLCIEEPFAITRIEDYADLQRKINTPICLDENIQTLEQLEKAIELETFRVLNIKIGRLGGIYYVKQMIEMCRKHKIKYWIGSMVESGVSKILHVQLASLKDTYIPGDLSDSKRYFEQDVICPDISSRDGRIPVPTGTGLGVVIEEAILKQRTVEYHKWEE
jgi:O-succinylbenzoate synthase